MILLTVSAGFLFASQAEEAQAAGKSILETMKNAGFENARCPEGAVNCENTEDATAYTTEATKILLLDRIGVVLTYVTGLTVFMLIFGFIRLTVAAGGEELDNAKKHIKWTAAGLGVEVASLFTVKNVTNLIYDNIDNVEQVASSIIKLYHSLFG